MIPARLRGLLAAALLALAAPALASGQGAPAARAAATTVIQPLMKRYGVPGMAVGLVWDGQRQVFDYGVADLASSAPVDADTLFELGSVSKTFTATLAAWAEVQHRLALDGTTAQYLPELRGTPFGRVPLLDLATHTPGGLPLQVPDEVHDWPQLLQYLRAWRPSCPTGSCRTYSNIGIGVLGVIAGKALDGDYTRAMQQRLLPALGLRHTYVVLPPRAQANYAQGYTSQGRPIRQAPGVLDREAYGVRTTAADMTRFIAANLGIGPIAPTLRAAIARTHTGYFRTRAMTQDLIWEQLPYPTTLPALLAANAPTLIFDAVPVTRITPPQAPGADVWLDKTGATNGFTAYVALIPSRRVGIVLLANRSIPSSALISASFRILEAVR